MDNLWRYIIVYRTAQNEQKENHCWSSDACFQNEVSEARLENDDDDGEEEEEEEEEKSHLHEGRRLPN